MRDLVIINNVLDKLMQVHVELRGSLENAAVATARMKYLSRPLMFPWKDDHSDQTLGQGDDRGAVY